jgi:hypothetical protein
MDEHASPEVKPASVIGFKSHPAVLSAAYNDIDIVKVSCVFLSYQARLKSGFSGVGSLT